MSIFSIYVCCFLLLQKLARIINFSVKFVNFLNTLVLVIFLECIVLLVFFILVILMFGDLPQLWLFSGHRYYVTFIDDHSSCTWVYLLKKKSNVLPLFTQFLQMIKTQYNTVVRAIRFDNGGEYISDAFCSQLNQKGILHQLTCPQTPEQNGVAKCKNVIS